MDVDIERLVATGAQGPGVARGSDAEVPAEAARVRAELGGLVKVVKATCSGGSCGVCVEKSVVSGGAGAGAVGGLVRISTTARYGAGFLSRADSEKNNPAQS